MSVNAGRIEDLAALRLYLRVARLGSFSAAARESGISQSHVSRIIKDLEASLGAKLLTRTTRAVVATEAGTALVARVEPILAALDDATEDVRDAGELRGRVRMSMSTSAAIREIIPRVAPFLERHPALHLELQLEDRKQDLVRDAVDVALRIGTLTETSASAKLLTTVPRVVIASPAYLARAGVPATPKDLEQHRIVGGTASVVPTAWRFERGGEVVTLDLKPCFSTNENEGAIAATVAGVGITSTAGWSCERELADGSLVRILTKWKMASIPVHAVFPQKGATRAAARAVVEHLVATFRATSPAARGA